MAEHVQTEVLHVGFIVGGDGGVKLEDDGEPFHIADLVQSLDEGAVHLRGVAHGVDVVCQGRCGGPNHQQLEGQCGQNQGTPRGCHGVFSSSSHYNADGFSGNLQPRVKDAYRFPCDPHAENRKRLGNARIPLLAGKA